MKAGPWACGLLGASDPWSDLWSDPRLLWGVAILAVLMLAGTWLLARRRRGQRSTAAILCAIVSVILHGVLIWLLPLAMRPGGGPVAEQSPAPGTATVGVASFSALELSESAAAEPASAERPLATPLPVAAHWLGQPIPEEAIEDEATADDAAAGASTAAAKTPPQQPTASEPPRLEIPDLPKPAVDSMQDPAAAGVDQILSELLAMYASDVQQATAQVEPTEPPREVIVAAGQAGSETAPSGAAVSQPQSRGTERPDGSEIDIDGAEGRVLGDRAREFANRRGAARHASLLATGGDEQTEAAVAAGIAWLARFQRADGGWDPKTSGAGIERSPLGQYRGGAGARATTGLTGLALLSMLGCGETHQQGAHAASVRRGLQYLLAAQTPDGSLAGEAELYERTYCHGLAGLAMAETAAMSGDAVATASTRSAVGHTLRSQHPITGGWRYVAGDAGDLSQLGWQVMVLASGRAAGVPVPDGAFDRTQTFLRSVRAGRTGGLACYKPGEAPSRTMTAEALAIRLLIGETVPRAEIEEAEAYLLSELPGTAQDNYYYWYYASLALHQLQDDAWRQWNAAMKARLLATQLPDGSWSTATVWGGNGGKVYTTAMACLCLEVYYRHLTEGQRGMIAERQPATARR